MTATDVISSLIFTNDVKVSNLGEYKAITLSKESNNTTYVFKDNTCRCTVFEDNNNEFNLKEFIQNKRLNHNISPINNTISAIEVKEEMDAKNWHILKCRNITAECSQDYYYILVHCTGNIGAAGWNNSLDTIIVEDNNVSVKIFKDGDTFMNSKNNYLLAHGDSKEVLMYQAAKLLGLT